MTAADTDIDAADDSEPAAADEDATLGAEDEASACSVEGFSFGGMTGVRVVTARPSGSEASTYGRKRSAILASSADFEAAASLVVVVAEEA